MAVRSASALAAASSRDQYLRFVSTTWVLAIKAIVDQLLDRHYRMLAMGESHNCDELIGILVQQDIYFELGVWPRPASLS